MKRRKHIAWIAIAAMLFGAVSPALAAALFAGHAEILGRMLAIPAAPAPAAPQTAAADDDGCQHESASAAFDEQHRHDHDAAGRGSHEGSGHAAHEIFCSFCLAASATLTLPAVAGTFLGAAPVFLPSSSGHECEPESPLLSSHRSRAPPASL